MLLLAACGEHVGRGNVTLPLLQHVARVRELSSFATTAPDTAGVYLDEKDVRFIVKFFNDRRDGFESYTPMSNERGADPMEFFFVDDKSRLLGTRSILATEIQTLVGTNPSNYVDLRRPLAEPSGEFLALCSFGLVSKYQAACKADFDANPH